MKLLCTFVMWGLCLSVAPWWAASPARAGGIPADTLKNIKSATVFVKVRFAVRNQILPATGSGFVMKVDGTTGFIATNHHVVNPPNGIPGIRRLDPIQVVFHSSTAKEKTVNAEIVATDPSRDLALLRVTNFPDLPPPIPTDPKLELLETMTVYVFGFPFGQALSTTRGNPAITVGRGSVSSIRNDEFGKVKVVQIDGDLNPGNSGGPVVDDKGRLIGIAVATVKGTRIGLAIPPNELALMLLGRVGSITLTTVNTDNDGAEVRVRLGLIDPLHRMKGASILYMPANAVKQPVKISKQGKFPALVGASRVDLKIDKDQAEGTFHLPAEGKRTVQLTVQTAYVNADGVTMYTAPLLRTVDFTQKRFTGMIDAADPREPGTNRAFKVHRYKMEAGHRYVIDMQGDPRVLDPYLKLKDADGKVLAEDDDSGGGLNARIDFTAPRTEEYEILAMVLRGTGPYTLIIREGSILSSNEVFTRVQEIGKEGLSIASQLVRRDPPDPRVSRGPCKVVRVRLSAGQKYVIDLKSKDFDAFLRLENDKGRELARDDDSGGGLDAQIHFLAPADGVYRIIATCFQPAVGEFTLTVRGE